jgi:hypothetical protein
VTNPAEEDSPSEVLRATHLLVIQIMDARVGDWTPEPDGLKKRLVALRVRLEHVWKGDTSQKPGEEIAIPVEQRGTGTYRVADDYGVWSKVELAPGLRLLAFCRSSSNDLAELLQPPQCEQLGDAPVAADVRVALELEMRNLTPAQILAAAPPLLERGRGVLARYIWARVREAVLADEKLFELYARIIEHPPMSAEARDVLLTAVYEELGLAAAPARGALLRLACTMLALLSVPQAQSMHANLAQVYLPNLIGLARGRPEFTAAGVFGTDTNSWAMARAALASHPEWDPDGELSQWLAQPPRSP